MQYTSSERGSGSGATAPCRVWGARTTMTPIGNSIGVRFGEGAPGGLEVAPEEFARLEKEVARRAGVSEPDESSADPHRSWTERSVGRATGSGGSASQDFEPLAENGRRSGCVINDDQSRLGPPPNSRRTLSMVINGQPARSPATMTFIRSGPETRDWISRSGIRTIKM